MVDQNFCVPKSLDPKFFWTQNFIGLKFFFDKIFLLDQNLFWTTTFFFDLTNIFDQTNFGFKIFGPKILLGQNYYELKYF